MKQGRADLRGAGRVALFFGVCDVAVWAQLGHHVAAWQEVYSLSQVLVGACFSAMLLGGAYLAVEPFVRRRWPQSLVSWSRMMSGQFRNALVGRDLLYGTAIGLVRLLMVLLMPGAATNTLVDTMLRDSTHWLSHVVQSFETAWSRLLVLVVLFVVVRLAVRRDWIAAAVVAIAMSIGITAGDWRILPVILVTFAISMVALIRYGVVVLAISEFVAWSMVTLPVTADFSAWYATGPVYCALAVLALAAYGFHCARDRRPALHAG